MRLVKLRYYADSYKKEDHQRTLTLLSEINEKYGISVEVERIKERHGSMESFPGKIKQSSIEEVYNRDFHRNRTLSTNIGRPPSKKYKTGGGYISITGYIGIIDNGLQWATTLSGHPSKYKRVDSTTTTIGFLNQVLSQGKKALREKYQAKERDITNERDIVNQFIDSEIIEGKVRRELKVGTSIAIPKEGPRQRRNVARELATRNIDLVIKAKDYDWVIEVKKKYDANSFDTALGQVLFRDELYRRDNELNPSETKKAIVFGKLPSGITIVGRLNMLGFSIALAKALGIEIFLGTEKETFLHLTKEPLR